jgi:hypothetical protein
MMGVLVLHNASIYLEGSNGLFGLSKRKSENDSV